MTPPPGGAGAAIQSAIGAPIDTMMAGMRGPPRNPMFPPPPPSASSPPITGRVPERSTPMLSQQASDNPALRPTQSTYLDELLRKLFAGARGPATPASLGDLAGD
jgi:hypothetical protein